MQAGVEAFGAFLGMVADLQAHGFATFTDPCAAVHRGRCFDGHDICCNTSARRIVRPAELTWR